MQIHKEALELYNQAIISDVALGFEPEIEVAHKWDLLPRYLQLGFNYLGLALAGEFTSLEKTMHYLSRHRARIANEPNKYILVKTAEDIVRAKQEGKLAVGFWLQGSNPLGNDLAMIETYYQLGIRYILLAYNTRNAIGDGITEKNDAGLSNFGIKVIHEMNRVGMLIDGSHAGIKTTLDIMSNSSQPIIFSHSNVHAINPHPRNLNDEQIKALAKNGGVIGINGMALLLGNGQATSEKFVQHIDYISNLVGAQHVALGLDLVYFPEILELFFEQAGATYPKGYVQDDSLRSMQPEKVIEVVERLLKLGYSEDAIKGILGENFLRVARAVWK